MDTAHEVVKSIAAKTKLPDGEIARRAGSSQPTIWRLRTGKTKDCSADLYRRLCQLRDQSLCKVGAGDTAPAEPDAAPVRALACASQSVRLSDDRRELARRAQQADDRRELARRGERDAVAQPDQLPLVLDASEPHQEAA